FRVGAGIPVLVASHFATINLQRASWLLLARLNLGFFLRENLLLCASYLPLGVPNERVSYTPSGGQVVFVRNWAHMVYKYDLHYSDFVEFNL
ncbi:hypothetical protein QYE76_061411, partial [Lolium multiflorum]